MNVNQFSDCNSTGSTNNVTPIPTHASETTRENPWPLALFTARLKDYIARGPAVWVKGEVVEYTQRPGTKMAFFTLRDLNEKSSMTVKCFANVLPAAESGFGPGAKLVLHAKPDFYEGNGQLSLFAREIHTLGIGDILLQIERLRKQLAAEGLFDQARKQPLPTIPHKIGLIVGRNAKALHDVVVNAKARWPIAEFEIREVAVQGIYCVKEVTEALRELDAIPEVDVIVIARGGGSVEDLLPFSDENMVRAAAQATTPLVGAIGHETDCPLLDYVVDYRASTPTDAARKIVPDLAQELEGLTTARQTLNQSFYGYLMLKQQELSNLRAHPVIRDPREMIGVHLERLDMLKQRLNSHTLGFYNNLVAELKGLTSTLNAVSPQAVLERGYSIVKASDGTVIRKVKEAKIRQEIELVFADGSISAEVKGK